MKSRHLLVSLGLLWLVGVALRLAILAVPPVIPALRNEFRLSGTEIGVLSGVPIIVFALAALVGSRLVARVGVVAAVASGLLLTALGSAGRGFAAGVMSLFAATVVMGVGVAVTQPAMPALVGRWLPGRIVLGTGVYTNGLLVGEISPGRAFSYPVSHARRELACDLRFLGGAHRRNCFTGDGGSAAPDRRECRRVGALVA